MKKFTQLLMAIMSTIFGAFRVFADTVTTAKTTDTGFSKLTDGVRKVYSKEIEFKALPVMRFLQFASVKTDLGVQPGLTIAMMTYNNLTKGTQLTEGTKISAQALSSSMKEITVSEYGNAVAVTELLVQSSFTDILGDATTLLSRDYAITVDCMLRDSALSTTNVVYASAGTTPVTARKDLTSASVLKVATIKDGVEILATNNTPKFNGADYICFVHPHQSRGLRDDSAWINASHYGAPEQLFTGEIGKIDDVRFIETTLMCNGACASTDNAYKAELVKDYVISGTGESAVKVQANLYQAVIFGDNYYGIAFALPVELRDNGVQDYGREHGLAWYSIMGSGLLNSDRGVRIETA